MDPLEIGFVKYLNRNHAEVVIEVRDFSVWSNTMCEERRSLKHAVRNAVRLCMKLSCQMIVQ